MTISISELERIEREMIGGRWRWNEDDELVSDEASVTGNCTMVLFGAPIGQDNGVVICNPADRDGICAMRNAFPVLLRLARAALALNEIRGFDTLQQRHADLNAALDEVKL